MAFVTFSRRNVIKIGSILMTVASLVLLLYAWRCLYPDTDLAAFFLVPLMLIIFIGTYRPAIGAHQAKMRAAVIPGTELSKWLSGRLLAIAFSGAFTLIAVTVLAWQAFTITAVEAVALLVLCFLASGLSLGAQGWLTSTLQPPFARSIGMGFGYAVVAFVFFAFVLPLIHYTLVPYPIVIETLGLLETITMYTDELPPRGGWIAEVLSVFSLLEAIKVWFAFRTDIVGAMLYCFDAALVVFIVAKSSVAITDFFQQLLSKWQ